MGRRGIPLTPTTLQEYASEIAEAPVGASWVKRFLGRHPDVKVRWTTSLEACRANSLNAPLVREYFNILNELVTKHDIPPENIYNMDEKGLLLGIGRRVAALVDRDQKTLYKVEDGSRELVTVIETICADGTALHPTFIFKAARQDLSWVHDNPSHARYVLCSNIKVYFNFLVLVFVSPRKGGLTRNLAVCGLRKILSQQLLFVTSRASLDFSFLMVTTHIPPFAFATLLEHTISL